MIKIVSELEFKILDERGVLEAYFKKPMESLLRQMVEWYQINISAVSGSIRDTSNVVQSVAATISPLANAPATNQLYGIVVGTGTNAVSISDYKLQTQIAHGNGAGQLYYQACVIGVVQVVGSEAFFNITRNFNNNSGASITVQEAGLYVKHETLSQYFCLARDLTGAIEVLTGKTLATQYTFKVTV